MWFCEEGRALDAGTVASLMARLVDEARSRISPTIRRALLLPPDITRLHSGAGELTNRLYHLLSPGAEVDVIPTLGQHVPHTPEENRLMFGDIPAERIHRHDWTAPGRRLGEVGADYVSCASDGRADWPIPIEINGAPVGGRYDLVVNVGQVVPHEVLGMANHNKNYFIGLGTRPTISASHMAAARYGIENNLGQLVTPLRACYNRAEREFLGDVPDVYVLIARTREESGRLATSGVFVGDDIETYLAAARYAQRRTITLLDEPLAKVVAFMDAREFRSTWVANKAVYRARMAMADGGELLVIAPGVERFGEQKEVDDLIREHGYAGTDRIMDRYARSPRLREYAHAAAHLIHGSTEGRFSITYAPGGLTKAEVESVGYGHMDCREATTKYDPARLREGLNTIDGEDVFFIGSPSLGLWAARGRYAKALTNCRGMAGRMAAREPGETIWPHLARRIEEDLARLSGGQ